MKGCLWRTKDKPCEKHKPAVKESEEGNEMKSKEVTEAKLSGVTRFVVKHLLHAFMKIFRPGALKEYPNLINDLINLDPSDVKAEDLANIFNVSVEDAHEILEVGVANNDFTKLEDNSYSLKPTDTVVEAINKSKAKKLQAMVDSLGKRVAKLSAPPSAKTKITQSLERFEQKLAAMKDSLKDKGEPEENDSEEEPTEKKSSKKEFPAKKKSFGDSDEKPKASKKEAGTSEEKSKSEPAKEGEDAEPKPKEQKETKSDKPDTNGDDSTPKGKVKDIGKGIYESESALLREYSKLIAEADKEEEEKAPLVSRPHDDHPRNKKPRLLAPTTKHGIAGNMSVPTRG